MPAFAIPTDEPDGFAEQRTPSNIRRALNVFSRPAHAAVVALPVLAVSRTFATEPSGNE